MRPIILQTTVDRFREELKKENTALADKLADFELRAILAVIINDIEEEN